MCHESHEHDWKSCGPGTGHKESFSGRCDRVPGRDLDRLMRHHAEHGGPCGGVGAGMGQGWASFFEGGRGVTRRFLRPVVLLLLAESPYHGYELMGKLKEFGFEQGAMDPSILYRLLRNIEREGLASSSLDDTGSGPARKVYALTPEGQEVLDLWAATIGDTIAFLERFKERFERLGKQESAS
ncbi:MAG: PadR family transcriptional regulator [Actinobacteria bacterium]|nr:PadR family transcriptional regulator [Actinomycetota bacterium]MBU1945018.1 PadR family transcriptional regulator [Actinomycetota bacterium]MBU2686646.1 PadR family transcriptional regulator [Actinomycetota bacterium]